MIQCTLYRADGSYKTSLEVPSLQDVVLNMDADDHIEPGLYDALTRYEGGKVYVIERPLEDILYDVRLMRDRLLRLSDWTDLPTAQLSADKRAAWELYRQDLRDITDNLVDPLNPQWPTPPD